MRTPVVWSFALGNLALAGLLAFMVSQGLSLRWWVVDAPIAAVVLLWTVAAVELLRGGRRRLQWLRISATCALCLGLTVIAALSASVSYLSGVQGHLGPRSAMQLLFGIVAIVPYFVIYPSLQLVWVFKQRQRDR